MDYEQILREQRDDVVVLTLNRPEKLNAWTPRMSAELTDAIEAADADPSVGRGRGDRRRARASAPAPTSSAVFDAQIQGDDGRRRRRRRETGSS